MGLPPEKDPTSIGNVLIELGFCNETQLRKALQNSDGTLLGLAMVAMGVITKNQLDWALVYQRTGRHQAKVEDVRDYTHKLQTNLSNDLKDTAQSIKALAEKIKKRNNG